MKVSAESLWKLCRFAAVGILATCVYYFVLWGLVEWFGVPVMAATSIAFVLVVAANYCLHYWWTFRSDVPHAMAFRRFGLMNVIGFVLNWSIMYMGVQYARVNYLLVQAVAIAVVVTWNFALSNFWIFASANRTKQVVQERR